MMARFLYWIFIAVLIAVFGWLFMNRTGLPILSNLDKYFDAQQVAIASKKLAIKGEVSEIEKSEARERELRSEAKSNSYSNPALALRKQSLKFQIFFWSVVEALLKYNIIIYAVMYFILVEALIFIYERLQV